MKVRVFLGALFAVALSGTNVLAQTWQEALAVLGEEPAEYGAARRWRRNVAAALREGAGMRGFSSRHIRVTAFGLFDSTDTSNELEVEREWLLNTCECPQFLSCNALDCRDPGTGAGTVYLRFAPMPASRPVKGPDFVLTGSPFAISVVSNGYPCAWLDYTGGEAGMKRAFTELQRRVRGYRAGRDGVFLSNTWGDGNRDARINEAFLLREVEAGAELGVDVIQIDDGWQKGRTANSAVVRKGGGTWGKYWDVDPDFWKPCPERFPRGLEPVVAAARAKGLRFGLWFGPDSSNEFRHWEKDAACLLDFHRRLGIDYFKMDSMCVMTGVAERRQRKMFDRMLEESRGAMVFDLDCTANVRPGFFGLADIGPLFVENRYIRPDEARLYWPHMTLRTLWSLARVIDPVRLRIEVLNPLRHPELYGDDPLRPSAWPADALFAIAMTASPLGWFEISNLAPETSASMKPLIATWKRERANLHGGVTHPVGKRPDGVSWTGFLTEGVDGAFYALLFRELSDSADYVLDLSPFGATGPLTCRRLAGRGSVSCLNGRMEVKGLNRLDYVWVKIEKGI